MPASSGVRGKVPAESHLPDSRRVISMNTRALRATVRSLYYRQRLARDLPQLEETWFRNRIADGRFKSWVREVDDICGNRNRDNSNENADYQSHSDNTSTTDVTS